MADVFVSHAEEDEDIAVALVEGLEAAGYSTWHYQRDSLPGRSYLTQVAEEIDRCRAVVLIISSHSVSSRQVTTEVIRGYESQKPFIPLLVDLSHLEFQDRQPEWRAAVGAAASVRLGGRDAGPVCRRVVEGLRALSVLPSGQPEARPPVAGTAVGDDTTLVFPAVAAAPVPEKPPAEPVCPQCGRTAPPNQRYCMGCGAQLPRVGAAVGDDTTLVFPTVAAAPVSKTPPAEPVCPQCGRTAPPNQRYCMACGAQLPGAGVAPDSGPLMIEPAPQRKKSRRRLFAILAVALIVLACIGVAVFLLTRGAGTGATTTTIGTSTSVTSSTTTVRPTTTTAGGSTTTGTSSTSSTTPSTTPSTTTKHTGPPPPPTTTTVTTF
jgi:hypothetical protein